MEAVLRSPVSTRFGQNTGKKSAKNTETAPLWCILARFCRLLMKEIPPNPASNNRKIRLRYQGRNAQITGKFSYRAQTATSSVLINHPFSECKGPCMSNFRNLRAPSQDRRNIRSVASAGVFAPSIDAIGTYLYEVGTWNPIKHLVPDKDFLATPLLHFPNGGPHRAAQ